MTTLAELEPYFMPEPNSGCWIWLGALTFGYGKYGNVRAHRVAYEAVKGPIPQGLVIDHLCRVRCCVNPDHLEAVTHTENVLRGVGPTALNHKKSHCPSGHEYTEENTIIKTSNGRPYRCCKACHRAESLARWRRNNPPKSAALSSEAHNGREVG